jgi:hypothetical protein
MARPRPNSVQRLALLEGEKSPTIFIVDDDRTIRDGDARPAE